MKNYKNRILWSFIVLVLNTIFTIFLFKKWIIPMILDFEKISWIHVATIIILLVLISIFVLSLSSIIHKLRDDGITAGIFCSFFIFGPIFGIIVGLLFSYDKETHKIVWGDLIIPAICGYIAGYLFGLYRGVYCEFFIKKQK